VLGHPCHGCLEALIFARRREEEPTRKVLVRCAARPYTRWPSRRGIGRRWSLGSKAASP
jgi:hypothetical protein